MPYNRGLLMAGAGYIRLKWLLPNALSVYCADSIMPTYRKKGLGTLRRVREESNSAEVVEAINYSYGTAMVFRIHRCFQFRAPSFRHWQAGSGVPTSRLRAA